ncbi:MAG TPA: FAD-binding oxidoreductase [Gemmatimonadaceae bacterium]|nr:FAD-binding oxidoreductase [Gemmatimonadaceae bacterium]
MNGVTIRTTTYDRATLDSAALERFAGGLEGELLSRESPGYDAARALWNAMIDRSPALIARCRTTGDVVRAVHFAREHGLPIAVRGGGHNIAGTALCDDGLVIDLSPMKGVRVDAERRTARVQAGATLGDMDRATQEQGLATSLGINSTTGVAGLTLGGGFGWLTRKYGLTVDNLLSAEVVTADGERVTASEREHPDLFWALRGGGGNFGIVTEFEYRLHPVGPEVLAGMVIHPLGEARTLLRRYREVAMAAPDDLTIWVVMRLAPPLPFLPAEVHGTPILVFAALYAGDIAEGERAMQPLRAIGTPIADVIGPMPYAGFQTAFDPLLTPGARNYWKSHNFTSLEDGLLDLLVRYAGSLPGPECEVFIAQLGGAASRVPVSATAYAQRDARFTMNVHARWSDASQDEEYTTWARALFEAGAPYATGGAYVNFLTEDETARVREVFDGNYDRLVAVKTRYDPRNIFRFNMNIPPSSGS